MSMYDETKKVLEGCDELMNVAVSQMDFSDFLELDENTMKAMATVGKLYKQSKDLALKQAEIIDKLERQNDELLEKINVLLARTKAIQESGDPSGSPILFLFNLGQIYLYFQNAGDGNRFCDANVKNSRMGFSEKHFKKGGRV